MDGNKDQSYFLHALSTAQVSSALFPVGELEKPKFAALPKNRVLSRPVKKTRPASVLSVSAFLTFSNAMFTRRRATLSPRGRSSRPASGPQLLHLGTTPRPRHRRAGTIRMSLGLWLIKTCKQSAHRSSRRPAPVVNVETPVGPRYEWIGEAPTDTFRCSIKVRYRSPDVPCSLAPYEGGWRVAFDQPEGRDSGAECGLVRRRTLPRGGVIESFER